MGPCVWPRRRDRRIRVSTETRLRAWRCREGQENQSRSKAGSAAASKRGKRPTAAVALIESRMIRRRSRELLCRSRTLGYRPRIAAPVAESTSGRLTSVKNAARAVSRRGTGAFLATECLVLAATRFKRRFGRDKRIVTRQNHGQLRSLTQSGGRQVLGLLGKSTGDVPKVGGKPRWLGKCRGLCE
jgi:hypothetical protein